MKKRVFEILDEHNKRLNGIQGKQQTPNGIHKLPKPFFHSIALHEITNLSIDTMNGGTIYLSGKEARPKYCGRIEMRMGDPKSGCQSNDIGFNLPDSLEIDPSLRELWVQSNECYWDLTNFYDEMIDLTRGRNVKRDDYFYFAEADPIRHIGRKKTLNVGLEKLESQLKEVSRYLASRKGIIAASADFYAEQVDRYLVNSEGTRIYTSYLRFNTSIDVEYFDEKRNRLVPLNNIQGTMDLSKIPSLDEMLEKAENLVKDVKDIVSSPAQSNGVFPTILCPENHGVWWHEVVGHALEAHRMQATIDDEIGASVFYGRMGEVVAPEFISLYDDPTIRELDGHYLFDEEGVPAQRVELIRNGRLVSLLHSRQTAEFFNPGSSSNGHYRGEPGNTPTPRMSNIIKSENETSYENLKEELMRLCVDSKKPYGLIIEGTQGGETLPDEAMFHTFPKNIHRLYPDGRMERVRDIYIVGTPHTALGGILMTSNEYKSLTPFVCGAESGLVPATETAPHVLVNALEVNRDQGYNCGEFKNPAMPMPKYRGK